MPKKSFRLSCAGLVALLAVAVFVVAFVGSVVLSETTVVPTSPAHTQPAATATRQNTPIPSGNASVSGNGSGAITSSTTSNTGDIQVSITTATPTSTPDVSVHVVTMTPIPSQTAPAAPGGDLGTLSYPLTVTAEGYIAATKVNAFYNSVDATRTAAAIRVAPTIVALTATAAAKHQ